MRRASCRSVPRTKSPPRFLTASYSSEVAGLPQSLMSTPRPAMFVAIVTAACLPGFGLKNEIVPVVTRRGFVRRDNNSVQAVYLIELLGGRERGAGHARELFVETEIVLERDRGKRARLLLNRHTFFRFDRLVQALRPPPPRLQAPGKLIHDHDLTVAYNVFFVALV